MNDQALQTEAAEVPTVEMSSDNENTIVDITDQGVDGGLLNDDEHVQATDDFADSLIVSRPPDVPEKFWDADAGALRTETLLKSYLALEKKLGGMVPMPNEDDPASRDKLQRVLGKPESADGYKIDAPHELITPDSAVNAKLHEAGLSSEQAQLVYDLAAEHLVPMIAEANRDASQQVEHSQLTTHFGGEQKWQAMAPQIKTWAKANLNDDVYDSLGASADGVIAIYHMMQAREPNVISEAAVPASGVDQRQLSQMMRDPRYWRDRDPAFVAEVTAGYKQLFE